MMGCGSAGQKGEQGAKVKSKSLSSATPGPDRSYLGAE